MVDHRAKTVFTTGEVAQICKVSQQTVIRCFDSGRLNGFRVPGSRFRRIPRDSLISFMKGNGIPLDQMVSGKRRVLVVDDDPAIIEMFCDLLGSDDRFELKTATSGYEAGIQTEQFRPDVILLDFKLPDINGTTVCRTIRANPKYEHMKIIACSGVADPDEVRELLDAGANEFIRKPFVISLVIDKIATLVKVA